MRHLWTLLLVSASLVWAGCPVFQGTTTKAILNHPRPKVTASFESATGLLNIEVVTALDPWAALVLDFVPVASSRTSLKEVGVCENRNSSAFGDAWTWPTTAASACTTPDKYMYPNTTLWTRVNGTCPLVTYRLKQSVSDIVTRCGQSVVNITTAEGGYHDFRVILYATYLETVNGVLQKSEHQFRIVMRDSVTIQDMKPTIPSGSNVTFSTPVVTWSTKSAMVTIETNQPYGNDGLLCNFRATESATGESVTPPPQDCQCDLHCSTFFCSRVAGKCTQKWNIYFPKDVLPGSVGGTYTMKWNRASCSGWMSGDACPPPKVDDVSLSFKMVESVTITVEAESRFVPYARIAKLTRTNSTNTTTLQVRARPLGMAGHGVKSIRICEVPSTIATATDFTCGTTGTVIYDGATAKVGNTTHLDISYSLDQSVTSNKTWMAQVDPEGDFSLAVAQIICPASGTCIAHENISANGFTLTESCGAVQPDEEEEEVEESDEEVIGEEETIDEEEEETVNPPIVDPPTEEETVDGFVLSRSKTFATLVLSALGALLVFQ